MRGRETVPLVLWRRGHRGLSGDQSKHQRRGVRGLTVASLTAQTAGGTIMRRALCADATLKQELSVLVPAAEYCNGSGTVGEG